MKIGVLAMQGAYRVHKYFINMVKSNIDNN